MQFELESPAGCAPALAGRLPLKGGAREGCRPNASDRRPCAEKAGQVAARHPRDRGPLPLARPMAGRPPSLR